MLNSSRSLATAFLTPSAFAYLAMTVPASALGAGHGGGHAAKPPQMHFSAPKMPQMRFKAPPAPHAPSMSPRKVNVPKPKTVSPKVAQSQPQHEAAKPSGTHNSGSLASSGVGVATTPYWKGSRWHGGGSRYGYGHHYSG